MRRKLLITEHNKDIRTLYEVILAPFQVDIVFADGMEEAKKHATEKKYDMMVLEISHVDELRRAESISALQTKCPVMVISSVPATKTAVDKISSRPNWALFMKPFDIQGIRDTVHHFLYGNLHQEQEMPRYASRLIPALKLAV